MAMTQQQIDQQIQMSRTMALRFIQAHPEALQNNPRAQELYRIIQDGDQNKGIEIANNLCQNHNASQQDAISLAMQMFGFR